MFIELKLISLFLLVNNERLSLLSYKYTKAAETSKIEHKDISGGNRKFKKFFLSDKNKNFFFFKLFKSFEYIFLTLFEEFN